MYDKDSIESISYVTLYFNSKVKYYIYNCISTTDLPVQPSIEVENIWMITKTATALIITCNDVEVLNYLFADSSDSECVPKLGGNIVEEIRIIRSNDKASYFYKEGKDTNSK